MPPLYSLTSPNTRCSADILEDYRVTARRLHRTESPFLQYTTMLFVGARSRPDEIDEAMKWGKQWMRRFEVGKFIETAEAVSQREAIANKIMEKEPVVEREEDSMGDGEVCRKKGSRKGNGKGKEKQNEDEPEVMMWVSLYLRFSFRQIPIDPTVCSNPTFSIQRHYQWCFGCMLTWIPTFRTWLPELVKNEWALLKQLGAVVQNNVLSCDISHTPCSRLRRTDAIGL